MVEDAVLTALFSFDFKKISLLMGKLQGFLIIYQILPIFCTDVAWVLDKIPVKLTGNYQGIQFLI